MQLKKFSNIRGALALATCTTLHGTAHAVEADVGDWKVDSAVLYYDEKDRVRVVEPAVSATALLSEDESFTLRGVFDTMSGATPNGAVTASTAQTFTSPSGHAYTTGANKLPTMSFQDLRGALGFDWSRRTSRLVNRTITGDLSLEHDYSSIGGSTTFAFDTDDRMRTYAIGLGVSYDAVNPIGGKPTPLSLMSAYSPSDTTTGSSGEGSVSLFQGEKKLNGNLLLGVTQILSRRALMQLNYTRSEESGYLNDPYKLVSLVDSSGTPVDAVFEKRPDHRGANALFWKYVFHLPEDVVHLSYRYYWDDWGIKSNTADLTYHMELGGGGTYLEPHLRYYSQSQADFYHSVLLNSAALPTYASADYRLAKMTSTTVGLKLGIPTGRNGEFSVRAETMRQVGDSHPADAVGQLRLQDLYPGLDATIVQISYSTVF